MATWESFSIALCKTGCVFSQHEKSKWMTHVYKRPLTYKISPIILLTVQDIPGKSHFLSTVMGIL